MESPQTVSQLTGFPYSTFDELQQAYGRGEIGFGIDRSAPFQLVSGGAMTKGAYWFATIITWSGLWAVAPFLFIAWGSLGWWSLGMFVVGYLSALFSRPWGSQLLAIVTFLATVYGFVAGQPLLAWYGVAVLVVWLLVCGMFNWCHDDVMRRVRSDESFFIKLWLAKVVSIRRKSGPSIWSDSATA